jgi:hypothetical protein
VLDLAKECLALAHAGLQRRKRLDHDGRDETRYLAALGDSVTRGKGKDVPPTDPAAFIGHFYDAAASGRYSGREIGFAFETIGLVTTEGTFAEFGNERNGVFL